MLCTRNQHSVLGNYASKDKQKIHRTRKDLCLLEVGWGKENYKKVVKRYEFSVLSKWAELCWVLKNWCFWPVVLEETLESPLDCKEIQPVHPKGNQSWIFIGRTDAEAEAPILWPPDANNWLTGKDPDAGKYWRLEKGMTENEMVGWHHQLNRFEFEYRAGLGCHFLLQGIFPT